MGPSHEHGTASYSRAFAVGVVLNLGFVAVEFIYGQLAHSLALVADAGHNLSDVLALLLAWGAGPTPPDARTDLRVTALLYPGCARQCRRAAHRRGCDRLGGGPAFQ
jgi:Cation efflux family